MLKKLFAQSSEPAESQGLAFIVSLTTAGLTGLLVVVGLAAYWASGRPLAVALNSLVTLAAALISAWLCRRGRPSLGIGLLASAILLSTLPFLADVVAGQSITLAVIIFLLVVGITLSTLPRRWFWVFAALAALEGAGFIFYDYYLSPGNAQVSYVSVLLGFGVLATVYGYLNRRTLMASGFRFRMIAALLVVSLAPLLLLSWMNSNRLTSLSSVKADQDLTILAEQTALALDNFVQTQMDTLRTEALVPSMQTYFNNPVTNSANALSALHSFSLKNPVFITSYAILDRSGKNLLDTNPANVGRSEADRQYAQTPFVSGRPYVSGVMFYEGQPRLYFSSPIRSAEGQVIGLLRAEYNAAALQWVVKNNSRGAASDSYVVLLDDENYLRLAHSRNPQQLYQTYADLSTDQVTTLQKYGRFPPGPVEQISTRQVEVVEGLRNMADRPFFTAPAEALGGSAAYSTARHLSRAPWIVLSRTSVAAIQSAVRSQTRSTVILALLSGIFVILAALAMAQVFATPIARLTRVAEQVSSGNLSVRAEESSQDEIGVLARTFNGMTVQLKDTLDGLEQRVADRTRALELSSDVSRRLSTILDPSQLVVEVVELLKAAFDYYHVHIYLWDAGRENLVMMGGTGEVGKVMLERGHSLPRGRGLVGQAAEVGSVVLVADTRSDPNWLPNPLLPETRSELAAPIMLGDEVLGALDVQQDRVNGLGQQDVDVVNSIASQLAIALQNARRYQQTQGQAQRESATANVIEQIQKTQTLEEALQVATRELGRLIRAPRVGARIQIDPTDSGYDGHSPIN